MSNYPYDELPRYFVDALAELMPNMQEIHKLSECGHVLPLEKQEAFQAITRRFLGWI